MSCVHMYVCEPTKILPGIWDIWGVVLMQGITTYDTSKRTWLLNLPAGDFFFSLGGSLYTATARRVPGRISFLTTTAVSI